MKRLFFIAILSFLSVPLWGQYTEIINSNLPGNSQSAYSVGGRVLQFEGGLWVEQRNHNEIFTDMTIVGLNYSVRYGLLSERLEVMLNGTMAYDNVHYYRFFDERTNHFGFVNNTIGAKYLIYTPKTDGKPNIYSWKANNAFKWSNLIPAVGLYAGMNFFPNKRYFYDEVDILSPKAVLSLQSQISSRIVLVGNIIANRFLSKYPEWGYVLTLTHNLDNGRFSIFMESEGIQSGYYSDQIMRLGGAYLFTKDIQINADLGASWKNTPSRYTALLGFSYRIDNHKSFVKAKQREKLKPTKIKKQKKPKTKKKWLLF
ncbi:transporter [Capnocytophaga sp.]|uniref:transporter n=1 Tax=Capnocytophaga sp. TaxID=44737 RepID=UPI0026DBCFBF|nr:transporter [Capnocytophaga sp.]MDO5106361.1 transporter [Capnocytophaga sp.]